MAVTVAAAVVCGRETCLLLLLSLLRGLVIGLEVHAEDVLGEEVFPRVGVLAACSVVRTQLAGVVA